MLIFSVVYLLTIVFLYWAFKQPELVFTSSKRRKVIVAVAVVYVAAVLLSAIGKESVLYHLFIGYPLLYAVVFRNAIRKIILPATKSVLLLFLVVFLFLWVEEIPVATDYIITGKPHYLGLTSILKHLISYVGFYAGISLTILFFYRRWNFSLPQVFTVGGLWGVLTEQQFLGPSMLFSGALVDFFGFAAFVFPTYGLYLAGPLLLFYEEFHHEKMKWRWQSLALFFAITVIPLLSWFLWSLLLKALSIDFSGVI